MSVAAKTERTAKNFHVDAAEWFSQWQRSHEYYGPFFVTWVQNIIERTQPTLETLYTRYGIRPSMILDRLALHKHLFLTYEELETGQWVKDVPDWYYGQTRTTTGDTRQTKILRNKKLTERAARKLESAAQILIEMPIYLMAVATMPDPFSLPDKLKAIAKTLRDSRITQRHRPQLRAALMVVSDLTGIFKSVTGKPLYEYAGELTKVSFPQEWNPAGDVREAAKKLIKSGERITTARTNQHERDLKREGLT